MLVHDGSAVGKILFYPKLNSIVSVDARKCIANVLQSSSDFDHIIPLCH